MLGDLDESQTQIQVGLSMTDSHTFVLEIILLMSQLTYSVECVESCHDDDVD